MNYCTRGKQVHKSDCYIQVVNKITTPHWLLLTTLALNENKHQILNVHITVLWKLSCHDNNINIVESLITNSTSKTTLILVVLDHTFIFVTSFWNDALRVATSVARCSVCSSIFIVNISTFLESFSACSCSWSSRDWTIYNYAINHSLN